VAGLFHFRYARLVKILALVVVLAVVGCGKSRNCDTAITNAIEVGNAGSGAPDNSEKPGRIKASMIAHCKADKWGDDVLACYGGAKDNASLAGCIDKLTREQQDRLMTDLAPILSGGATPIPQGTPVGSGAP
jgi:hypothetical protein